MGKTQSSQWRNLTSDLGAADAALLRAISVAGGSRNLAEKTGWSADYVQGIEDKTSDPDFPAFSIDVERATGITVEQLCPDLIWFRDQSEVVGFATPVNIDRTGLVATIRNQYVTTVKESLDPLALVINHDDSGSPDIIGYGIAAYTVKPGQTVSDLLGDSQAILCTVMGLIRAGCPRADDHEGDAIARLLGLAEICLDQAYSALAIEGLGKKAKSS